MTEFNQWKEREEEITYTTYVRQDRTYTTLKTAVSKIMYTKVHDIIVYRHSL